MLAGDQLHTMSDAAVGAAVEQVDAFARVSPSQKNRVVRTLKGERGIAEGRKSFGNINRYVLMATSSNFGNMLSMALASTVLPSCRCCRTRSCSTTSRTTCRN